MKITGLHIEEYKNLKNLEFDFTYPKGHKKAGQPLDKICFIGQSATGKTNLLKVLQDMYFYSSMYLTKGSNFIFDKRQNVPDKVGFSFKYLDNNYFLNKQKFSSERIDYHLNESSNFSSVTKQEDTNPLLFFTSNLISKENISIFDTSLFELNEKVKNYPDRNFNRRILNGIEVIFDNAGNESIWLSFLDDIIENNTKYLEKSSELVNEISLENSDELSEIYEDWKKDNPNLLEDFAKKFNPILNKLNLKISTVTPKFPIPILDKNSKKVISVKDLSTGTKGLLLSILPLYKLNKQKSVVLFDEPERSLYPDLQMEIVHHYKNLAPNAQFVVATHSPFIAANFEPEERFILYFDKTGKVNFKKGTSPIGDDPNDILKNDFAIDYNNPFGKAAYENYLKIKKELLFEKDSERKKSLVKDLERIGELYNF